MKTKNIIENYKAELPDFYSDKVVVEEAEEWKFYSSIAINTPIAMGWLENDNIFTINNEGAFIYDTSEKQIIVEDYDENLKPGISNDNSRFFYKAENITLDVFGIRGGGGNLVTMDSKWSLRLVNLAWNIPIPIITNNKTGAFYFLKLNQLLYEGWMHIGLSKSEKYFAIMGDAGIDIYCRLNN